MSAAWYIDFLRFVTFMIIRLKTGCNVVCKQLEINEMQIIKSAVSGFWSRPIANAGRMPERLRFCFPWRDGMPWPSTHHTYTRSS
jgi:hypothetical protein